MHWKKYAIAYASDEFDSRAFDFQQNPSAENWHHLDRAMKAHQKAKFLDERTLESLLKHISCSGDIREERKLIVNVLAHRFDTDMEDLQISCLKGNVRLIRAAA